jgi:hypothetical protein
MTVSPDPHPTAVQLARWLDGRLDTQAAADVRAHHAACGLCQAFTDAAGDPPPSPDERGVASLAGQSPSLPEQIVTATSAGRGGDPTSGQLWRLEWEGWACLAIVVDVLGTRLRDPIITVPVTTDPDYADQYTLCVAEDRSPLGLPLAAWVALRTRVPRFVFDLGFGDTDLVKDIDTLYHQFLDDRAHQPDAPGLWVGHAIVSPADPRWEYRETVAAAIAYLADAADRLEAAPGPIGDVVAAKEVHSRQVAKALELDAAETHALLSGAVDVTAEHVRVLADLLGVPEEEIAAHGSHVDPDLRLAWATPESRDRAAKVAAASGQAVEVLREMGTRTVTAQAARQTGTDAVGLGAWEQLVHDWLDTQA